MNETPIYKAEYAEFKKRMEAEHETLYKRIKTLENQSEQVSELALSIRELAVTTRSIAVEQQNQGKRLSKLEEKDGEMWRKAVTFMMTTIIGMAIGALIKGM